MKIMLFTTVFNDSAVSSILLQIIKMLKKDNTIILVTHERNDDSTTAVRTLKSLNVPLLSLGCRKTQVLKGTRLFTNLMNTINPDIIHAHLGRAYIISLLHKKKPTASVVLGTFHNNKHYFSRITQWMLSKLFHRFDGITAVSNEALQSFSALFSKKKSSHIKRTVIYNPLVITNNNTLAKEEDNQLFNHSWVLGVAGRLASQKGHKCWLDSMQDIHAYVTDVALWCAGSGPLQEKMQRYITHHKLHNVFMLGYRTDVHNLMARSHIVLFTSQNEGFGLVPCESLIQGIPTIVQDLPVMREILGDDSVWLTDCNDREAFITKIITVINNYEHYKKLANITRTQLQEKFNTKHIVKRYWQCYTDLVNKSV